MKSGVKLLLHHLINKIDLNVNVAGIWHPYTVAGIGT
jgi:hypothetical protein